MTAIINGDDGLETSGKSQKETETIIIDTPLSYEQVFLLFNHFKVLLPGDSTDRNLAFIMTIPFLGLVFPKVPFTRFLTSYTKPYRGPGASQRSV